MKFYWKGFYHLIYLSLITFIIVYFKVLKEPTENKTSFNSMTIDNKVIFDSTFSTIINVPEKYNIVGIIDMNDCPTCIETIISQLKEISLKRKDKDSIILYIKKHPAYLQQSEIEFFKKFRVKFKIVPLDSVETINYNLKDLKTPVIFVREKNTLIKIIQVLPSNLENVYNFFDEI